MQVLQILQVALFSISVLTLLGIGVVILARAVSIIDRRIFVVVVIPLLLANTLTFFNGDGFFLNWRTWLILGADLVLIIAVLLFSHGFQVYGLDAETVAKVTSEIYLQQGYSVETNVAQKRDLWGRTRDAYLLTIQKGDSKYQVWIVKRFNEVSIRTQQRRDSGILHPVVTALQQQKVSYEFKDHAAGLLYIVLAVVLAVLSWIFFFEPRLILVE